ncbi:hypothetical protein BURPS305_0429 [Burkholderia pseudomallei 305]|nr:hypothetical protein BURPS305_0429 [Burkholderia pseudomallei 305]
MTAGHARRASAGGPAHPPSRRCRDPLPEGDRPAWVTARSGHTILPGPMLRERRSER